MAIKFFNDVAVDSNVLYVDTINDRVGIGTTNPSQKLDVAGRAIIGTGNTIGTVDASIIGSNNNATTDTIIDSSTSAVIGDANSGRYGNTVISDRTLRIGRADNIGATSSNTTGILNFNDFVGGNNAYVNFGGFLGYFPPPTSSNDYYFFTAHDKNVLDSVFQAGASPEAARINMSTSPRFGTNSAGNDSNSVIITADGNNSAGAGLYFTANQNHTNPSSRGIFTFDARHQNQNATVPDGHSLFEVTSGYGQTKFVIKQVSGSTNVGIGTTSPSKKLHVSSSDQSTARIRLSNTNTASGGDNIDLVAGIHNVGQDGFSIYNATSSQTQFVILGSGNVGIGTTSPSLKLHVAGNSKIDGVLYVNNTSASDATDIDNLNSSFSILNGDSGDDFPGLDFARASNLTQIIQGNYSPDGNAALPISLNPYGGNVGIGTASPGYKLEVSNSDSTQTTLDSLTFRAVSTAYAGTVGVFENTSGINTSIRISDTVDDMYIVSRNGIMGLGPSGGWSSTNLNITSLGLVGIGARNPLDRLHVNGSARVQNGRVKFYEGTAVNRGHVGPNGSLLEIASTYKTIFKTGPTLTEKMRLTDDGRLLLNTPDDASASDARFEMIGTATDATTNFTFKYNGKLGLGDYTPVAKITVVGTTNNVTSNLVQIKNTSNTGSVIDFRNSAGVQAGLISMPTSTSVSYGTTSDYRLKTNVVSLENGIDKVKKLKPSRFEWINDGIVVDGFIAHEVKEVVPEAVTGEKDAVDEDNNPVYQTIDHSKIIPVLTAALQEAIQKIEQLETRIQTLENK